MAGLWYLSKLVHVQAYEVCENIVPSKTFANLHANHTVVTLL